MVKKRSKFEVNSGNTLRTLSPKERKVYQRQPFLICQGDLQQTTRTAEAKRIGLDKELYSWNVGEDNIVYSLNKKARWQLPSFLTKQIHSGEHREGMRVSLLECHKFKRPANCVSYHTSKGKTASITPRNTYFSPSSIRSDQGTGKAKQRRKTRHKTGKAENGDDQTATKFEHPGIVYQVYYPCPKTSALTHTPKFIAKHDSTDIADSGHSKRSSNRRVKQTTSFFLDIFDEEVSLDEYFENSLEIDDDISDDYVEDGIERQTPQTLDELVNRAIHAKDVHVRHKHSDPVDEVYKDDWVFVDEELLADYRPVTEDTNMTNRCTLSHNDAGANSNHKTMPNTRILISPEHVTAASLRKNFGEKYLESHCLPRQFGIDVTEEVAKSCRRRKLISSTEEPWTWVIFTDEGVCDRDLHVFRIQVNSELCPSLTDLVTLFEMNSYTVQEVCQSVTMFVECCSADSFQNLPAALSETASQPILTFRLLKMFKSWRSEVYHSSQSHKTELVEQRFCQVKDPQSPVQTSDGFCRICCTPMDMMEAGDHDYDAATCLLACGHWFCNDCWREHLKSSITCGLVRLQCPETDCKMQVDHLTALTLIPATEYKKFLRHCHDNKMQSESDIFRWCPNPKCGRVLKAFIGDTPALGKGVCVTCNCGLSVCFDCLGKAHWPAYCQQASEHRRKLKDSGDEDAYLFVDVDISVVINVKYCPGCHQPIQKDGGCRHMVCACGCRFCWLCLTPEREHPPLCDKSEQSPNKGTERIVIHPVDILECRPKLYAMSVRHRYYRQPRLMKEFIEQEKCLKAVLKRWCKLQCLHSPQCLAMYGIDEEDRASVSRVVKHIIRQSADLALELHFVIENTAIALQYGSPDKNTDAVEQIIERMELIVSRINKIFAGKGDQDLRPVLATLTEAQASAETCLASLISSLP